MAIPRIVIDTNVVVSALKSKQGASFALMMFVGQNKFETNISVPLILEYEKLLLDPKQKIPFTDVEIGKILDFICRKFKAS